MKIHDLKPADGANKPRRRVGRGIGGHGGKTAGRGTKGQSARNTIPRAFIGGTLPLTQRIPKLRGFNNPFRVEYTAVNLDTLAGLDVDVIDDEVLRSKGLLGKKDQYKVLGRGEVSRKLTVKAHAFSKSAQAAIEGAGGTTEVLPPAHKGPRPAAKGNQHANR
jgi:large subunit ribosomal protein L15